MLTENYNGYKVNLIETVEELWSLTKLFAKEVSCGIDTETSGLSFISDSVAGFCFSGGRSYSKEDYQGYYCPIDHYGYNNLPKDEVVKFCQWVLDNRRTSFFNRPFDFTFIEKEGVQVPCSTTSPFYKNRITGGTHDVQQMCHLIMGDSMPALKDQAAKYLKMDVIEFSSNNAKDHNFKTTDPRVSFKYAAQDPLITVLLGRKVWADFPYIQKIYPLDNSVNEVMRRFTLTTILPLDYSLIEKEYERVIEKMESVKASIFSITGYPFRLTSNQDKAEALSRFTTLTQKTASGKFAVNEEVLVKLAENLDPSTSAHKLVKLLIEYAGLEKYRGSYVEKMKNFPKEGIRVNYSTCNVSTGRYSSGSSKGNDFYQNINIQNIPKEEMMKFVHHDDVLGYKVTSEEEGAIGKMKVKGGLRDAFICPEGYVMLNCDYSSQEMRVMANLSKEPNMIEPLNQGHDIHNYIAKQMFGFEDPSHRTKVKILNFAVNYGGGAGTIANKLGCTREEGQALLDRYNQTLGNLTRWKEEMHKIARRQGMVFTFFGRPRVLYQYYNSSDKQKWAFADRSAVNSPVQGFGGDLIRIAHVKLLNKFMHDPEWSENVKYASTVHDEISLFVKPDYLYKAYKGLLEIMTYTNEQFKVPLEVSPAVGYSWGTLCEIEGVTPDNKLILNQGAFKPL